MIKGVKKFIAKSTWPCRRAFSRANKRKEMLADMSLLTPSKIDEPEIAAAKRLLICWITPDTVLLERFLSHYRTIGVDHFLLVDGSGLSDINSFLCRQEDCSVWQSSISFKAAGHGTRIHNALIQKHCLMKWVLCVDSGEFFVFPYMETRSLADLTSQLDDLERTTLWALRIDLYGSGPLLKTDPNSDDLLYFDASGYYQTYGNHGQIKIKGGASTRIVNEHEVAGMPSLHKLPLIKPQPHVFYQGGRQHVIDEKLNWPHKWHPCPTGVLLSRDFNSNFCNHLIAGRNTDFLPAYIESFASALHARLSSNPEFNLMAKCSVPYESSVSLIDHGMMSDGGALRPASRFGIPEI